MSSAILVFDLIGTDASLELKCNARGSIQSEFDDGKEAVGFVVREKG
jgi:hypothetical protein